MIRRSNVDIFKKKRKKMESSTKQNRLPVFRKMVDGESRSELPVTAADLIPSCGRTFHVTQLLSSATQQ